MEEKFLTTSEAAKILRVHPITIRRWVKEGKLAARRVGVQLRFEESGLNAMAQTIAPEPQKQPA